MDRLDFVRQEMPLDEIWAQLGEEATELSHAAQKMRRIIAGRNPSPVSMGEAKDKVFEELADVLLCLRALRIDIQHPTLDQIQDVKLDRWVRRLKGEEI